jgi:aminoglycoside N3'-acetyltransferase
MAGQRQNNERLDAVDDGAHFRSIPEERRRSAEFESDPSADRVGRDADAFVGGHERALKPFGAESPFARLLERNALILGFDATFSSFTFTHFVEDQVCSTIPVPLYEPEPMQGNVIDYEGNARTIDAMVLSARANALRREHRLQTALENGGVLKASRIGNTLACLYSRGRFE